MEKQELSPKVLAVYKAVAELFMEGADLSSLTVSGITARVGIGKGTVYDYFANQDEAVRSFDSKTMRERLCRDICRDVGESRKPGED